jgi:hypothetical protein
MLQMDVPYSLPESYGEKEKKKKKSCPQGGGI